MKTLTDLSIWQVKASHSAVLEALADEASLTLDLQEVEKVDAAGLQLLWLAHREAAGRLQIVPGEALEAAADRLAVPHFWSGAR